MGITIGAGLMPGPGRFFCAFCGAGRHPSYPDDFELNVVMDPNSREEGIPICDRCLEGVMNIHRYLVVTPTEIIRLRRDGKPADMVAAVDEVERFLGLRH